MKMEAVCSSETLVNFYQTTSSTYQEIVLLNDPFVFTALFSGV
jgi:hypothetical protein